MNAFITFFTALLAMGSAIVLDRSLELMRRRSAETFIVGPRLWGGLAVDLLFVAVLLISTWMIGVRFRPVRWVSLLLLILSGVSIVALPLAFTGPRWLLPGMSRLLGGFTLSMTDFFPGSLPSIQATSIFLASLYGLAAPSNRGNERHAP